MGRFDTAIRAFWAPSLTKSSFRLRWRSTPLTTTSRSSRAVGKVVREDCGSHGRVCASFRISCFKGRGRHLQHCPWVSFRICLVVIGRCYTLHITQLTSLPGTARRICLVTTCYIVVQAYLQSPLTPNFGASQLESPD